MGAESVTGGVRDTLAAALCGARDYDWQYLTKHAPTSDEWVREECWRDSDAVLAALSSPEVVRVATVTLAGHLFQVSFLRWYCTCREWELGGEDAIKANVNDAMLAHAAHQWSVLVSALRGER